MKCPVCGNDSRVLHSLDAKRRRECVHCRHRWTTREVPESELVKLDAARQLARAILEG